MIFQLYSQLFFDDEVKLAPFESHVSSSIDSSFFVYSDDTIASM